MDSFTITDSIALESDELGYDSVSFDADCGVSYFSNFASPIEVLQVKVAEPVTVYVPVTCDADTQVSCTCSEGGFNGIRCADLRVVKRACSVGDIIQNKCRGGQETSAVLAAATVCNLSLNLENPCQIGSNQQIVDCELE